MLVHFYLAMTSLWEEGSGWFAGRLFLCPYFVVSRFSALSLDTGAGLRCLIATFLGDVFIAVFHYDKWSLGILPWNIPVQSKKTKPKGK